MRDEYNEDIVRNSCILESEKRRMERHCFPRTRIRLNIQVNYVSATRFAAAAAVVVRWALLRNGCHGYAKTTNGSVCIRSRFDAADSSQNEEKHEVEARQDLSASVWSMDPSVARRWSSRRKSDFIGGRLRWTAAGTHPSRRPNVADPKRPGNCGQTPAAMFSGLTDRPPPDKTPRTKTVIPLPTVLDRIGDRWALGRRLIREDMENTTGALRVCVSVCVCVVISWGRVVSVDW